MYSTVKNEVITYTDRCEKHFEIIKIIHNLPKKF